MLRGICKPRIFLKFEAFVGKVFYSLKIFLFIVRNKGKSDAGRFRPARPSDPVDVILRKNGRVVINNMRYPFDVDAAGRKVGGHQHLIFAALEAFEGLMALGLRAVRMYGGRLDPALGQSFGYFIGAVLCPGKNEHCFNFFFVKNMDEQVRFRVLGNAEKVLFDGRHR